MQMTPQERKICALKCEIHRLKRKVRAFQHLEQQLKNQSASKSSKKKFKISSFVNFRARVHEQQQAMLERAIEQANRVEARPWQIQADR